jgi:hypothetical protein
MSFDDPIEWISHRFHIFPYAKCVLLKFSQVTRGNLKLKEALRACCLQGVVSFQKLHYHVKIARKALRSHSFAGQARQEDLVIDVCGRAFDCTADTRTTMSPLTEASALSTATAFPQQPQFASAEDELMPVIKRRKSEKQVRRGRKQSYALNCTTNVSRMLSRKDSRNESQARTQQLSHFPSTRLLQT